MRILLAVLLAAAAVCALLPVPDDPTESRLLGRLRAERRSEPEEPGADDPGAFAEAMAEIKTAADGSVYPPNYKRIEAARAERNKRRVALPWIERGPGNVSGRARAIVVDPDDATHRTWFVATVGGGIWKTTDAGATWRDLTPELTTLSTSCLAMCASQPDVLYAGTGMGYGRIVDLEGSGIWKSVDRGESWTQLPSTANGQILTAINRIVVDPSDPDLLVVCSNTQYSHLSTSGGSRVSGIFRSIDGGASWTQTFDPDAVFGTATDNRVQQIIADPTDFQKLYASVNEVGVVKSIDGGQSWTVSADDFALPSDVGNPTGGWLGLAGISVRTELAISRTHPNRLYAAVERPRGTGDLYMSDDAGASWSLLADTNGDPNWFNAFGETGGGGAYTAGWFDNTIAVHPYDPDVVFLGGVNLYRANVNPVSKTRFTSAIAWWIPNSNGLPVVHADHHWLQPVPLGGGQFWLLNANDGGVARSQDGGISWEQITGMGTTQFYGADKAPGVDRYVGGMQDNGTWASGVDPSAQSPWSFLLGGDGFEVAWNGADAQLMLYGSQFNGIVRSADGGQSWVNVPEAQFPGVFGAAGAPFITKIANDKTDPDLVFIVGSTGVRRSDDFGRSWTDVPFNGPWLGHRPFDNVEISIADPQVVWASSKMGVDPATGATGGIWRSTDGGLGFSLISSNFPGTVQESSGIGTHPLDGGIAYFCFSSPGRPKILRTVDHGATFEDLSGFDVIGQPSSNGFPDVAVFSLLVMPFDPDQLWAGTEIGLFVSLDGGQSWQFADDGLPHVAIFQLRIVDDQVLAATQGRGVLSVAIPELATFQWPQPTLAPRLNEIVMAPDGQLDLDIDLRSPYDSTAVWVDGQVARTLGANAEPRKEIVEIPVLAAGTVSARVVAYREGRGYATATRSGSVFPVEIVRKYSNDFQDTARHGDFLRSGFQLATIGGFADRAAQSQHPYPNGAELVLQLRKAIRVAGSQARLYYRDVCLVEKGVASHYTDPNFWDYVIVEGTSDGKTWLPLIDGYDSRANPLWSSAYDANPDGEGGSSTTGSSALFVDQEIDLLQSFAPGDLIFVRFRLYSDQAARAWGWAIDDLQIQPDAVGLSDEEQRPEAAPAWISRLLPAAPNPFNPATNLHFELARRERVELAVFDLAGRLVRRLHAGVWLDAGRHEMRWDGVDERGAAVGSGVYLVRLRTGTRIASQKISLVK